MLKGLEELVHHCKGCNRTTTQSLIVALVVNPSHESEDKTNKLEVVYRCRDCGDCNRYALNDVKKVIESPNSPNSTKSTKSRITYHAQTHYKIN